MITIDQHAELVCAAEASGALWEMYPGELAIRPGAPRDLHFELNGDEEYDLVIAYAQRIRRLTAVLREIATPKTLITIAQASLMAVDALDSAPAQP